MFGAWRNHHQRPKPVLAAMVTLASDRRLWTFSRQTLAIK
jgi:hypothetical protein